jgi:hypothetical protein
MKRSFKVPLYDQTPPEARMFAGTDVVLKFSAEGSSATSRDEVSVRMCRKHAEALRDSITQTLTLLDGVAAADGREAPKTPHDDRENPPSDEWAAGYDAGVREMESDGWSPEFAARFLDQISATDADRECDSEYGKGFNAAIRRRAATDDAGRPL